MEKKPKKQLEKLLAYENTNQKCQKAIFPIHETGTTTDYLKAYCNLNSETQKMQMLAETMAATFRKENERCFTCGDKNHLGTALRRLIKNLQKFALTAIEKYIGPKTVNLNLILKEKLFQETPSRNTQVPFNKNQGHILSFPSNPQHPAVLPSIYQP